MKTKLPVIADPWDMIEAYIKMFPNDPPTNVELAASFREHGPPPPAIWHLIFDRLDGTARLPRGRRRKGIASRRARWVRWCYVATRVRLREGRNIVAGSTAPRAAALRVVAHEEDVSPKTLRELLRREGRDIPSHLRATLGVPSLEEAVEFWRENGAFVEHLEGNPNEAEQYQRAMAASFGPHQEGA